MSIVCHDCIGNKHLKKYINEQKNRHLCDYCGKNKHSVLLSALVEEILDCLFLEYENAADVLGYDSQEGGYLGSTFDNYDLINHEFYEELDIQNQVIVDDIIEEMNSVEDITWCKKNFYRGSQFTFDKSLWNKFSNLVKYEVRYVSDRIEDGGDDDNRTSSNILDEIGKYVREPKLDLLKEFKKGDLSIFRGRAHNCQVKMQKESDFYPPPRNKASAGRMNPDGIPMFYVALDHATVQAELYSEVNNCLSIAEFINTKKLFFLDLTDFDLSKLPSIFDREKQMLRDSYIFLSYFALEISKKIDKEYNIEYIPTQIVTEYFRHCFSKSNKKLDGIMFPSSKYTQGKNIVLFINNEILKNSKLSPIQYKSKSITLYTKKYQ